MLTERERLFIEYWEVKRTREKTILYQLLSGLPMGLLFSIPIIVILFTAKYWYKRADMVANSQLNSGFVIIAVFLIALFVAILFKRHQWEMKEQQYKELKAKQNLKS